MARVVIHFFTRNTSKKKRCALLPGERCQYCTSSLYNTQEHETGHMIPGATRGGRTEKVPRKVTVAELEVLAAEEEDIGPTAEGGLNDLYQCYEAEG
jgi:hypothetical protein